MAEGLTLAAIASGLPVGETLAALKVTIGTDLNQWVAPSALVDITGSAGSRVATPIQLPTSLHADGGFKVHIAGDSGVPSTLDTDDGSVAGAQTNVALTIPLPYTWNGATWVRGGWTPHHKRSAANNNATNLKNTPGVVGYITASNTNANPRFVKFYNTNAAPTPASDVPVYVALIPGGIEGRGTNIPLPDKGIAFSVGISYAIVANEADNDNTSVALGEIHLNIGWL